MEQVFSKEWFNNPKTQRKLLWLLNHSRYFRKDMGIQDCDLPFSEKIVRIQPNSFTWRTGEREFMTDFRTHNKFGKRLYYGFLPVWEKVHKFDMKIANRFAPALNMGFDTLKFYPQAGSGGGNVTCDARFVFSYGDNTWSGRRDATSSNEAQNTISKHSIIGFGTSSTTGRYMNFVRAIYTIDSSDLTAEANISATSFSVYGTGKSNTWVALTPALNIYTSSPATDNKCVTGDFDQVGTVPQSDNEIAYADYNTSAYNDFLFNATGIGNVSKTGITKLSTRESNYDAPNVEPTWELGKVFQLTAYYADQTGTDNDPKLVVTYSLPVTDTGFFLMF